MSVRIPYNMTGEEALAKAWKKTYRSSGWTGGFKKFVKDHCHMAICCNFLMRRKEYIEQHGLCWRCYERLLAGDSISIGLGAVTIQKTKEEIQDGQGDSYC